MDAAGGPYGRGIHGRTFAAIGDNGSGYQKLMRNDGPTGFMDVTAGSGMGGAQSRDWVTHDFNNDGWLDILGGYQLWMNNGDMTFTPNAVSPGQGAIGDLNNDGFLDVLVGSNALLFAQRYQTLEAEATAAIVFSTVAFAAVVPLWLALLGHLSP